MRESLRVLVMIVRGRFGGSEDFVIVGAKRYWSAGKNVLDIVETHNLSSGVEKQVVF